MFNRRNKHERAPSIAEAPQIPPTDGRQLSLLPGHEDDPDQPVRILSRYEVDDMEAGQPAIRTEMIWAQTVADKPRRMRVENVNELLLVMGHEVEAALNRPTTRTGRCIIEYPRASETDPIRGQVYVLGAQLMRYDFEETGEDIVVTGAEAVMSAREKFELPVGTRITGAVSMKEAGTSQPAPGLEEFDQNSVVNTTGEPTEEEKFTGRIKDAIWLYKTSHS